MLEIGTPVLEPALQTTERKSRLTKTRLFLVLIVLGVIGAGGYAIWQRWISDRPSAERISTVRPIRKLLDSTVTTSGTVRLVSGAEVRVGSQVSGIVRRLNVTVGSRIEKGRVIAEIDPAQLQARVDQARAQLAIDRVAAAKAERDVMRVKSIADTGALSRQQLEDLDWQYESAKARVAKSESDLKAALVDLSYTTIRAPISGVVSSVTTQQGETVAASFAAPTFVTIVRDKSLELVAMVDETDIAGVKPGDALSFTVEAYPAAEFSGTVKRIDPTATIVSGVVNYPVISEINGDTGLLKPDMTANVVIETGRRAVMEVPTEAVRRSGNQRYVYVRQGRDFARKAVTVEARDGENSEVTGLSGNEDVVTHGFPTADGDTSSP